ncbi:PAS domain-containing protein [Sedimentimonas flavescens]|uniref:PAS domain-containing protein n=1 Tax=Sedimentimonas flavescens TaxID=2851012 RepID=UPI0021A81584|nr:PAS domain-containing protein [Sedimentimonas flavescens]MCT2538407.1 PAS domain-containing protein [Sedimentimonas flavescens]
MTRDDDTPWNSPRPAEPTDRVLADLHGYWEGLRCGRVVPARADIDPRRIEEQLEFAFVLERIAPGIARFRIAGQHLTRLMGMEVRGMPLSSLVTPPTRDLLAQVTERVFATPAVAEIELRAQTGLGRPALTGRMLLLPMSSGSGMIDRALGCLVTDGRQIGLTPRRFGWAGSSVTRIAAASESAAQGFAEPPAPFEAQDETPEMRRAKFRIVTSGE